MSVARFIADQRTYYRVPHTVTCLLLGVSLAWLMAKPANGHTSHVPSDQAWDRSINRNRGYGPADADEEEYGDYPVTVISGSGLRRTGQATDDRGRNDEWVGGARWIEPAVGQRFPDDLGGFGGVTLRRI